MPLSFIILHAEYPYEQSCTVVSNNGGFVYIVEVSQFAMFLLI